MNICLLDDKIVTTDAGELNQLTLNKPIKVSTSMVSSIDPIR
jgi:hypothetical protein